MGVLFCVCWCVPMGKLGGLWFMGPRLYGLIVIGNVGLLCGGCV